MDFQSLKEQIAGISLYDVKAAVRKAQNGKTLPPTPRHSEKSSVFDQNRYSGYELYGDGGQGQEL